MVFAFYIVKLTQTEVVGENGGTQLGVQARNIDVTSYGSTEFSTIYIILYMAYAENFLH